jgi:hypothetical protein
MWTIVGFGRGVLDYPRSMAGRLRCHLSKDCVPCFQTLIVHEKQEVAEKKDGKGIKLSISTVVGHYTRFKPQLDAFVGVNRCDTAGLDLEYCTTGV